MSHPILLRCPRTGMTVQHALPDTTEEAGGSHIAISCPACGRMHLVDVLTGKLLERKLARTE